jgi:hypothetical protein
MHPVAQGLPVHAIVARRLGAGIAIQNHRQRQQTANHVCIITLARQLP